MNMKIKNRFFKETDLHLIWSLMLFKNENLMTENSNHIFIEFPGIPTVDGGPDFRFARIFINGSLCIGSVELHIYQNGWESHDHENNTEYSNVVLHVCFFRTRKRPNNSIPLLILENQLKESLAETLNRISKKYPKESNIFSEIGRILDSYGDIRIRRKIDHLKLLQNIDQNEVLYREFMSACGYKHNKAQFYELARLVPFSQIKSLSSTEIEYLLLYHSGLNQSRDMEKKNDIMAKDIWRYRGVRPSNYPEKRIKAISNFIPKIKTNICNFFKDFLKDISTPEQFKSVAELIHDSSDKLIGLDRSLEIVQNVILPFYIAKHELRNEFEEAKRLFDLLINLSPVKDNFVTRYMKHTIFGSRIEEAKNLVNNLRRNWGLLQLYSNLTTQTVQSPQIATILGVSCAK